jgi:hypothetical protein
MTEIYHTFVDVIKNWPGGISSLARDAGVSSSVVSSWKQRNVIPVRYWLDLVNKAHQKGFTGLSLETLARIARDNAPRVASHSLKIPPS